MRLPTIVCLIGSTRFKETYEYVNRAETLKGNIVLSCGVFDHTGLTEQQRYDLNELHLRKIDMSDVVLVLNVNGYIGNGTRREIDYSLKAGKNIMYLEQCDAYLCLAKVGDFACCLHKGHGGNHKAECGTEFDNERIIARWKRIRL